MIARVLPPEEWGRLESTDILDYFRPEDSEVLVVEEEGEIVGAMKVIRMVHLEGLWIAPKRRGSPGIARKLLRGVIDSANRWSKGWVIAQVDKSHVTDLVTRAGGVRIPVDSYLMRLH